MVDSVLSIIRSQVVSAKVYEFGIWPKCSERSLICTRREGVNRSAKLRRELDLFGYRTRGERIIQSDPFDKNSDSELCESDSKNEIARQRVKEMFALDGRRIEVLGAATIFFADSFEKVP